MQPQEAASLSPSEVLRRLGSSRQGLTADEAARRLALVGPNAVRTQDHGALRVLLRQFESPLMLLLLLAVLVSLFVGERADAIIILAIVTLSAGLGFANEYRAARSVEALRARIHQTATVLRDGRPGEVDVRELVPGDIVRIEIGDVVPADLRLLQANQLECNEAILTGEAAAAEKTAAQVSSRRSPLDLPSIAFMGTVVTGGTGVGVVVATGTSTEFGKIAARLGRAHDETAFQRGLRGYSLLLFQVTALLAGSIFLINASFRRPFLDSALFALAIAVGLTPQLLPAIVTVSLSMGARRLARRSVVVKRLVAIEDFGNIQVLFTDKTGTLTEGAIRFSGALDADGRPSPDVLLLGLLCNSATVVGGTVAGGNPLDRALWQAPGADPTAIRGFTRLSELPFDYERRLMSVLVESGGHRRIIAKGAPESVLSRCREVPVSAPSVMRRYFEAGDRVIAVASRDAGGLQTLSPADEGGLTLCGFLVFTDPVKRGARTALRRLARLGIAVKIVTGDNELAARKVCRDLQMKIRGVLTGAELDAMTDQEVAARLGTTTIFARVSPDQKARIIRLQRRQGWDVAFLGDGVNDAVALHDADVGISVDSAADVAKEAADVVLLEKDLNILAEGVTEGRRVFANTVKYVLMGTSSNFGNMFSAAASSLFLSFLPMLPTQILLNNFLYDISEITIPTDRVDDELLKRPARWDTSLIRRFMIIFGPISSLYDFLTFAIMLRVFRADESLFRTGWFIESLATQTLVIFVIRTQRVPFFRSRPSGPLLLMTLACVAVGVAIPFTPLADPLGFTSTPPAFFAILCVMVIGYLAMVEIVKSWFFRLRHPREPLARAGPPRERRIRRRAARWLGIPVTAHRERVPTAVRATLERNERRA